MLVNKFSGKIQLVQGKGKYIRPHYLVLIPNPKTKLIMKRLNVLFAVLGSAMLLVACNPGWTDETKAASKKLCSTLQSLSYDSTEANTICECYVNKLVEKFPDATQTEADQTAAMDECTAGVKTSAEKKAEAEVAAMAEAAAAAAAATAETAVTAE